MTHTDPFIPPAAEGLPSGALDSASAGASMLDAWGRTAYGLNVLAHALTQLARDGWLRTEPGEGFEPEREQRETPKPEDAPAASAEPAPATARAGVPDCDRCDGSGLDPDRYIEQQNSDGAVRYSAEPCADCQQPATDRAEADADTVLAVLPAPTDRAAVLLEAADRLAEDAEKGAKNGLTRIYQRAAADTLRRMAAETPPAPQPAPCSDPPCNQGGNGEPCDIHETERAHAEGEHAFCGVTCEVVFPTEQLRNFVIAKGYPGTAGMLNELLRRAAVEARRV
jgi:hypothetical protein